MADLREPAAVQDYRLSIKLRAPDSETWLRAGTAEIDISEYVFKGSEEQHLLLPIAVDSIADSNEAVVQLQAGISAVVLQVGFDSWRQSGLESSTNLT